MNAEKFIFIAGPTEQELSLALQELADMYADTGYTEGIRFYKSTKSDLQYLVQFTNEPDFERFKYFVNYLHYPQGTNYKAKVMGFWTVSQLDKVPKELVGKRLLLYVSDSDTEGDNVFAIYEGAQSNIKFGFAMGEEYEELKSKEFDFAEPEVDNVDYTQIGTINADPKAKKKAGKGCAFVLFVILLLASGLYLLT